MIPNLALSSHVCARRSGHDSNLSTDRVALSRFWDARVVHSGKGTG